MSPRTVSDAILRDAPLLHTEDTVGNATRTLLDTDLPALPVVDQRERLAGVFGEREFLGAVFPGYLKDLKYAGFVRRSLEDALEIAIRALGVVVPLTLIALVGWLGVAVLRRRRREAALF